MPSLLSSGEIVSTLITHGFTFVSQKGSHQKYCNVKGNCVIVPGDRDTIPHGALNTIVRQSCLERELFFHKD